MKLPKIQKDWLDDLRKLPMVEVTWHDATTIGGWKHWSELVKYEPAEMKTCGRLLPPGSGFIRVVPSIGSNGDMSDIWLIPKGWITGIKRIK